MVGLILVWGSACSWPQNTSNGFRTPVIEVPDSSLIRADSLPTAPHLMVGWIISKLHKFECFDNIFIVFLFFSFYNFFIIHMGNIKGRGFEHIISNA